MPEGPILKIIDRREVPGLASLYFAQLRGGARRRVEFVDTLEPGVPKAEKWVMMISTQVGCAVGCRMCDAGAAGYRGNLSAGEMIGQVRFMAGRNRGLQLMSHPKVKVHFARMGEPALNPAVPDALRALAREYPNPGIIASISTVAPKSPAVEPWFRELLRVKDECFPAGRFQLQFSLHSTDEDERCAIVPIRKWSLDEVADYGRRFVRPGDRRVTLNFAPGPGEALDAEAIARVFDPRLFLIKVTPVNPTLSARRYGAAFVWTHAPKPIRAAASRLKHRGFEVILSPSSPEELATDASCGQLWSGGLKESASASLRALDRERRSYVTTDSMAAKAAVWLKRLGRGLLRERPFVPERAALLVVGMQDSFLDRDSPAYIPAGRAALFNTRCLVEAFRGAGRPVLFAASPGARVSRVLEARRSEVLPMTGRSAFSNPGLARRLRRKGATQIVLAGLKADSGVATTARTACGLGWGPILAADATAACTEAQHVGALTALARGGGVVALTAELVGRLAICARKR
jgi:23S rRNA (adenine2503-C2)-methyltransferase